MLTDCSFSERCSDVSQKQGTFGTAQAQSKESHSRVNGQHHVRVPPRPTELDACPRDERVVMERRASPAARARRGTSRRHSRRFRVAVATQHFVVFLIRLTGVQPKTVEELLTPQLQRTGRHTPLPNQLSSSTIQFVGTSSAHNRSDQQARGGSLPLRKEDLKTNHCLQD